MPEQSLVPHSGRRANHGSLRGMMPAFSSPTAPNNHATPAPTRNAFTDGTTVKNSVTADLQKKLNLASSGPDKAKAVLSTLDEVKNLPNAKELTRDIIKIGLKSTT